MMRDTNNRDRGFGRREGGGDRGSSGSSFGGGSRPDRGGFAPVNVGVTLTVTIEAVGEKGDGIAKKNGFVLFVPGTKAGELVTIKVTKVLRKVGFAEVVGRGAAAAPAPAAEESAEEGSSEEAPAESADSSNAEDTEDFGSDLEESKEEE